MCLICLVDRGARTGGRGGWLEGRENSMRLKLPVIRGPSRAGLDTCWAVCGHRGHRFQEASRDMTGLAEIGRRTAEISPPLFAPRSFSVENCCRIAFPRGCCDGRAATLTRSYPSKRGDVRHALGSSHAACLASIRGRPPALHVAEQVGPHIPCPRILSITLLLSVYMQRHVRMSTSVCGCMKRPSLRPWVKEEKDDASV